MMGEANGYSIGIEEEYFLVDAETGAMAAAPPDALFAEAEAAGGGRVSREMLAGQIEVATPPCASLAEARAELERLRALVGSVAAGYGLAILAAGTHPTARWRHGVVLDKERYQRVLDDLQMIGQRNLLCGMHVHVELPDPGRRVDVMARMIPYLPLLLALSTSSPFWQSRPTGLAGYRLAAYDEMPRTGLPEIFETTAAYERYVEALIEAGAIGDASFIWWALRPSVKYPTLELRAPDCCTRLEDTIAIAALYRALVRHLCLHPERHAGLDGAVRALAQENKWRAQRHGVGGSFVTEAGPAVAVGDFLEEVIAMTAEDADAFGCAAEIAHCRRIVAGGTSADAQLAIYRDRVGDGEAAALAGVLDWLAATTRQAGAGRAVGPVAAPA